jgi:succinyl-diaminopimelate desuccinylase
MFQERIDEYFRASEAKIIEDLSRLVAVKSVKASALPGMPFGKDLADALALALDIAQGMGFATQNIDNYVGTIDLNDQETKLGILCHLDVVGEGIGWSTPPFTAVAKDGLVYGRGVCDDKGPSVAALYALKAVKDLGIPLKYNARLILGTDEESGSSDIRYYFERQKAPPYTFSPDGVFPVTNVEKGGFQGTFSKAWDPSDALPRVLSVQGGYRTNVVPPQAEARVQGLTLDALKSYCERAEQATGAKFVLSEADGAVKIAVTGKGEHASTPETGINAVTAVVTLLASLPLAASDSARALQTIALLFPHGDYYGQALGIAQSDEISGPLTISFNIFELTATGCKGTFDCRAPLVATDATCADVIRAKMAGLGFQLDGHSYPGHHTPADSEFVKTLLAAYEQYTGLPGSCTSTGGGTYVHSIEGGVCFGAVLPDFDPKMHGADERMRIQDLLTAAKIFAQVIVDLCG